MTYEHLFFSFSGRIGRGTFWLGSIILALVQANYLIFMGFVLKLSPLDFWNETRSAQLVVLSAFLLLLAPSLCLGIKRLHDRGISGWWYGLLQLLVFQVHIQPFYGRVLNPGSFEWFALNLPLFAALIVALWLVVEMGFRRGEVGKNRYGDDPLCVQEIRVHG